MAKKSSTVFLAPGITRHFSETTPTKNAIDILLDVAVDSDSDHSNSPPLSIR